MRETERNTRRRARRHSSSITRRSERRSMLKKNYGLTLEEYDQMFEQQQGVCAICHTRETARNQYGPQHLSVDHDHDTGEIRGLLCDQCNKGIGCFTDSPILLAEAIRYLLESTK